MDRKDLAAFTIVQNEDVFSRIWVDYYSQFFDKQNMYVLNHDSTTAQSLKHLEDFKAEGVNVVDVHNKVSFDHTWLKNTVQKFQSNLLQKYKVVLFAEADEIITINPINMHPRLDDYIIDRFKDGERRCIRCIGFNIQHDPETEDPIDLGKPLLKQRSKWRRTYMFDKPLISNYPINWHIGYHWIEGNTKQPVDKHLILVHLHKLDYEMCKKKHTEQSKRNWSKKDIRGRVGTHNLMSEGPGFNKWFFSGSTFQKKHNDLVNYPEFIKNVV